MVLALLVGCSGPKSLRPMDGGGSDGGSHMPDGGDGDDAGAEDAGSSAACDGPYTNVFTSVPETCGAGASCRGAVPMCYPC